jgi:hypothetical protein
VSSILSSTTFEEPADVDDFMILLEVKVFVSCSTISKLGVILNVVSLFDAGSERDRTGASKSSSSLFEVSLESRFRGLAFSSFTSNDSRSGEGDGEFFNDFVRRALSKPTAARVIVVVFPYLVNDAIVI